MPFPTSVDALVDAPPFVEAARIKSSQVLGPQRITVGPAWINIKSDQYGALGDGVTNDSAAIQAALNAAGTAGGGIVYCPPGTYMIAPFFVTVGTTVVCLAIPDNVMLMGAGPGITIFKVIANASNVNNLWLLTGSKNYSFTGAARVNNNCAVRDLTFDGNSANQAPTTADHHGIVFWPVVNHYIENVTVQNLAAKAGDEHFGYWMDGDLLGTDLGPPTIVNGVIHACRAINTGTGFAAHTIIGEVFSDCEALNCTVFQGFTVWSGSTTLRCKDVGIIGCRADSCLNGIEIESASGTRVVGNVCRNNLNAGIQVTGSGAVGFGQLASVRTLVVGNTCYNNGQNNTGFFAQSGIALANATNSPTEALIIGNQCYDDQAVKTQVYGVAQDAVPAGSQNQVFGNNLRGNKTANTNNIAGLVQNILQSGTFNLTTVATVPTGLTGTFTVEADSLVSAMLQSIVDWTTGTAAANAGDFVQADLLIDAAIKASNTAVCSVTAQGAYGITIAWAQSLAAGSHTFAVQVRNATGARGNFSRGDLIVTVIPWQQ